MLETEPTKLGVPADLNSNHENEIDCALIKAPDVSIKTVSFVSGLLGIVTSAVALSAVFCFYMEKALSFPIIMLFLFVFGVIMIIAAMRLTKGSNAARWTLVIICACRMIGCLQDFRSKTQLGENGIMFLWTAYAVWVLLLRTGAGDFFRKKTVPVKERR